MFKKEKLLKPQSVNSVLIHRSLPFEIATENYNQCASQFSSLLGMALKEKIRTSIKACVYNNLFPHPTPA